MKKVFLLFGLAAFSSASAQQKDVFDINKHIQRFLNKKNFTPAIIKPSESNIFITTGSFQNDIKLTAILPNGDKVYLLPQDNMPCIVPGVPQNYMPNVSDPDTYFDSPLFKNNSPGSIPNVVKPYRLITSK